MIITCNVRLCFFFCFFFLQLGGTVGDIESMPFIEAFRQFQFKVKRENFCNIHVSLIPQVREQHLRASLLLSEGKCVSCSWRANHCKYTLSFTLYHSTVSHPLEAHNSLNECAC